MKKTLTSFRHATAFISSTFADMKEERNLMTYNVLPRIKKWAFDRGIIFDVVDLRWGINDEQANDLHHTIKLCLKNVKDSAPIFICFLGERYGWIPPFEDFNQSMFDKNIDRYKNLSATELEIVEALEGAILGSTPKSCMFLMRESLSLKDVPDDIRQVYKDDENSHRLQSLKNSIKERNGIFSQDYSAKFNHKNDEYYLDDFVSNGTPLEDVIFENLTKLLTEKYDVSDEDVTFFDDVLTRQRFHQKELMRYPMDTRHQSTLNEFLDTTLDFSITPIGTPHNSAIFSQISHFIETQKQVKNQDVICRFWGLSMQINSVNDLICSLAYEFSNDKKHLNHPIESLLYLKNHLENATRKTLLVIAGIPYKIMPDLRNIVLGLKWTKMLVFYDTGDFTPDELSIDNDDISFRKLAKFMFEKKAKFLTEAQLDKVLQAAQRDYSTLKIIADYLCNFAQYETLDSLIDSLANLDVSNIAKLYIASLCKVQNAHVLNGIMGDVIEILCNSPLPLSQQDIVDSICLERGVVNPSKISQIDKEVAFSLRFASSLIDEYNSRFKINDEIVKTLVMFDEDTTQEAPYCFIPKESNLILSLRQVYINRLKDKNAPFNERDAHNLLEIIKDYSDGDLKQDFTISVLYDTKTFYKLAKALGKNHLVDLFKTFTMQTLGMDVDSYFVGEMNRIWHNENDSLGFANAIMQEKIFSTAKTLHSDNIFMQYYLAVQKINADSLESAEHFEKALALALSVDGGCHKIALPASLDVSKGNCCAYTIFDPYTKSYANFYGVCTDGFLIILNVWTDEMVTAFALPRDLGNIACVFYQEHTIHIVYEKGVICFVNLWSKQMNMYRIFPENIDVNTFENYYSNGCQVAVADNRRIVLFDGARVSNDITFAPNMSVLSAYGLNANKGKFTKVCIIAKDENDNHFLYSVDMQAHKIIDQSYFPSKQVESSVQDENANDVYIHFSDGTSCVAMFDENGNFDVYNTPDRCMYSLKDVYKITQDGDDIKYNGKQIASNKDVKCCFSSRSLIAVLTSDNTLYCIDNGY